MLNLQVRFLLCFLGQRATAAVRLAPGDNNVTVILHAAAADIDLWWPAGSGRGGEYGAHPALYNVTAVFTPAGSMAGAARSQASPAVGGTELRATRRVGFRTVALVTGNDTDPAFVAAATGAEGSGQHGTSGLHCCTI